MEQGFEFFVCLKDDLKRLPKSVLEHLGLKLVEKKCVVFGGKVLDVDDGSENDVCSDCILF